VLARLHVPVVRCKVPDSVRLSSLGHSFLRVRSEEDQIARRAEAITAQRAPLSKERVLRTAIDLADHGGIDSLSMRRLAHELGVEAMSLYYYVANKDELLNGMVDMVVSEIEPTSHDGEWRTAVRKSAISFHDVLKRHPWATNLMMGGGGVSPARMRYMESLLRRLREVGFSPNLTHHAYHALDSHIIGSTLWHAGYSAMKLPADFEKTFVRDIAKELPYLAEHAQQHVTKTKGDVPEFEFGLEVILDGLEKILKTKRPARARSPRRST
jgi:AcrR family transcriptional regulator